MEALKAAINRVFEVLGMSIRAHIEDDDALTVRDLLIVLSETSEYDVYDISNLEEPIYKIGSQDINDVSGVVVLHIVKKIIANALN